MAIPPITPLKPLRRDLENLKDLSRQISASHYRAAIEKVADTHEDKYHKIGNFTPSAWWAWLKSYGGHIFDGNVSFPSADEAPEKSRSIYRDTNSVVKIAFAGDWGTGTDEAQNVAWSMKGYSPDYTIHIGDVYYIGDRDEVQSNCLGVVPAGMKTTYTPVKWPLGSKGSFALNGNHEMYANGDGYFNLFLPQLGKWDGVANKYIGQGCSFFCLVLEHWVLIGIDTGYNSRGLPFLGQMDPSSVSWIQAIQNALFKPSCKLEDELVNWLKNDIKPLIQDKAVMLMSHHQYFSKFTKEFDFDTPAQQVGDALDLTECVWLWGHEHRFTGYKHGGNQDLKCHGRCIGHGGMPVSITKPEDVPKSGEGLLFFDNRIYDSQEQLGWNGYVLMEVDGPILTLQYFDISSIRGAGIKDQLLVEEKFSIDQGTIICTTTQYCVDEGFFGPNKWG